MQKGIYSIVLLAFTFILFHDAIVCQAQKKNLPVHFIGECNIPEIPASCQTLEELIPLLGKLKQQYQNNGYPDFSVDTLFADSAIHISVHLGERFLMLPLTISPPDYEYLLPRAKNLVLFQQSIIDDTEHRIIKQLNNLGYVLASLEKKTTLEENTIAIHYLVTPHEKFYFDTLSMVQPTFIHPYYVMRKTAILPNQPYQPNKTSQIKQAIDQTGFMAFDSSFIVLNGTKARVHLFLHPLKNSQFTGIIGMSTNEAHKLELTGDVGLLLVNLLNHGEQLSFKWNSPAASSQNLDVNVQLPYIFKSPAGAMAKATFEKLDSSYSNTTLEAGILIEFFQKGVFTIKYQWNNSSVGSNYLDTYTPYESNLYGFEYKFSKFNYPVFPTQGVGFGLSALIGNQTKEKATTNGYQSLFSEIQLKSELIYPLTFGSVQVKNRSSYLFNDSLPANKFYRLGGFNSFEGFQEQSIACKGFTYFTGAYRIPLNETSLVQLFYQVGWFNESGKPSITIQMRQSMGVGLNLDTPAGRLSLSFALGKEPGKTIRFDQGKLHIGYANRF